jgi:type I site-specific restriction endonuclease
MTAVAGIPDIPIEESDVITLDECHRSTQNVWRQLPEYFDAFLLALTATPLKKPTASSAKTSSPDTPTKPQVRIADGFDAPSVGDCVINVRERVLTSFSSSGALGEKMA